MNNTQNSIENMGAIYLANHTKGNYSLTTDSHECYFKHQYLNDAIYLVPRCFNLPDGNCKVILLEKEKNTSLSKYQLQSFFHKISFFSYQQTSICKQIIGHILTLFQLFLNKDKYHNLVDILYDPKQRNIFYRNILIGSGGYKSEIYYSERLLVDQYSGVSSMNHLNLNLVNQNIDDFWLTIDINIDFINHNNNLYLFVSDNLNNSRYFKIDTEHTNSFDIAYDVTKDHLLKLFEAYKYDSSLVSKDNIKDYLAIIEMVSI